MSDADRAPLQKHFIIATAGHVDHGKSALVQALTGTDPDRLPEEKARQITIDLGFAELNLPGGIHVGIVDVPGHEDFVRNMIAGVGSIDLALFVVAADDGWMPQSEEHLRILGYLGVRHAIIALTKTDLETTGIEVIQDRLRDTPFAQSPIIRTSVRTGEGLEDLKSAFAAEFATMQPPRDYGKPRLFIDRVFTLRGIGTVVTGTLTGAELRRGQKIAIQPGNRETRVRSIQSHGREVESAQPGMRTAINLPDVEVEQVNRGDVITMADLGQPSGKLLARVNLAQPLKSGTSVYLHHGTSRYAARILSLEQDGLAHLKLASPIFAFLGDRFVLRDASERRTIGGGIVLDPDGDKHSKLPAATEDAGLCLRAAIASRGFVRKETLLRKSHFSADEIGAALLGLEKSHQVAICGELAVDPDAWESLRTRAIRLIDAAHQRNPERPGLALNELRASLRGLSVESFAALMTDLCADGFVRAGSAIARITHQAALPVALQPVEKKTRATLSDKPFDPTPRRTMEADPQTRQVLRFLIENGEIIEISEDVLLLSENFAAMRAAVVDFISKNGPATVSELRQALQSSRRVMVPFLERLDRDGITRRVGEKRLLR
jgi:selenocysteine-specific elongation factor